MARELQIETQVLSWGRPREWVICLLLKRCTVVAKFTLTCDMRISSAGKGFWEERAENKRKPWIQCCKCSYFNNIRVYFLLKPDLDVYTNTDKETHLKNNRMATRLIVLLALILAPLTVLAQVTKGSISGSVVDASGALISDASVKVTNTQAGTVLQVTSDKSGFFRFSLLPPGTYKLEISKAGFNT